MLMCAMVIDSVILRTTLWCAQQLRFVVLWIEHCHKPVRADLCLAIALLRTLEGDVAEMTGTERS